jgi:hypothetical protein
MSESSPRRRRAPSLSKTRYRNLSQFKDMPDEEFEEMWQGKMEKVNEKEAIATFEQRIEEKIKSFASDYDLDDLKANDLLVLRALAQAYISLEDFEIYSFSLRSGGLSDSVVFTMEKLDKIMSTLRKDISNMQNDLNMTRRVRKSDKETSVLNYLDDLKNKAKKFYKEKMQYVFCPKCKMLLGTIWTQYPEEKGNKLQLICGRHLSDGKTCGEKVQVTTLELLEKRGVNIPEEVPEFYR